MTQLEAIKSRHSVRQYKDQPVEPELRALLCEEIDKINAESGLNIQLICDEPKAFDSFMAHYGNFTGVSNYFAIAYKKGEDAQEKIGYYGERLVLFAQSIGLHTCWVALTYKRVPDAIKIAKDEKLSLVISVGHGRNRGVAHKSKPISTLAPDYDSSPEWFKNGVDAALLAPTATNQQKFTLTLEGDKVKAKAGLGFYSKMDLGIVKYHFEIGSGRDSSIWA